MTYMYELDPHSLEIYRICEKNFLRQAFDSYRLTERQTDTTEIIYHAASRVVDHA